MTYGWAILIIAVVLGALFSLGVFSSSSLLGTACIASSGYYCGSTSWTHGTTTLSVIIGQSTGSSWGSNIFFAFVPQGTATLNGIPNIIAGNVYSYTASTAIPSGQQVTVPLPIGTSTNTVGTSAAGSIWVCYGSSTVTAVAFPSLLGCSYAQLATLTVKAT